MGLPMHEPNIAPDRRSGALDKPHLRARLFTLRAGLQGPARAAACAALADGLLAACAGLPPTILAAYWPIRGEPDLRGAWDHLRAQGWSLALPVVTQRDSAMVFRRWDGTDPPARDTCGVRVPASDAPTVAPDVVVLPCVGFNQDGYRLGYGGGYYDRTLANRAGTPRLVGIAFAQQACEFTPDVHDLRLDQLVTERGIRRWR